MTASKTAKKAGLESLAEVGRITGVGRGTLSNWHKHKPTLFKVVLAGCVQVKLEGGESAAAHAA